MLFSMLIPVNENGIMVDPNVAVNLEAAFADQPPEEIYIYSHGWWTAAIDAMIDYNHFGCGLGESIGKLPAKKPNALAIGIHWPSMLSENSRDWFNCFEPLSFYTMEKRADHVGAHGVLALLRLILARIEQSHCRNPNPDSAPIRIHLLGHSFGCKVICAALQAMVQCKLLPANQRVQFNVVLLQAAFETEALDSTGRYGQIAQIDSLRMLISKSACDRALTNLFRQARQLDLFDHASADALGATGPTAATQARFNRVQTLNVGDANPDSTASLVVADLSAIHTRRAQVGLYHPDPLTGQHSDIYFAALYALVAQFLHPICIKPPIASAVPGHKTQSLQNSCV